VKRQPVHELILWIIDPMVQWNNRQSFYEIRFTRCVLICAARLCRVGSDPLTGCRWWRGPLTIGWQGAIILLS
jgi:fatty acid desaturase